LAFSSWIDKPWFHNWGKNLLLCSSHLPLGVPNWPVIIIISYTPAISWFLVASAVGYTGRSSWWQLGHGWAYWYVSNISIIFDAPCLFLHHLPIVLLHFVALLCIFQN
jgi:hypothetical protein